MSAADTIKPFLLEADRRKPGLKIANTISSCFELLELTLALAGPDFAFVGKSASMDGSKFRPAWFTPHIVSCVRPDGQAEDVMIAGVGMDAAWHLPTMTQVKVIVNSTDGELADGGKGGPAQLTPYVIDRVKDGQVQYRWHNPPIAQNGAVVVPPMPVTPPAPPAPAFGYPDENTVGKAFQERVRKAYSDAGRAFPDPNDRDGFRHFMRFGYSAHEMDAQKAADKHIRELRADLGAPAE